MQHKRQDKISIQLKIRLRQKQQLNKAYRADSIMDSRYFDESSRISKNDKT